MRYGEPWPPAWKTQLPAICLASISSWLGWPLPPHTPQPWWSFGQQQLLKWSKTGAPWQDAPQAEQTEEAVPQMGLSTSYWSYSKTCIIYILYNIIMVFSCSWVANGKGKTWHSTGSERHVEDKQFSAMLCVKSRVLLWCSLVFGMFVLLPCVELICRTNCINYVVSNTEVILRCCHPEFSELTESINTF